MVVFLLSTFNLISFAWIFFRASSLADALTIIMRIFTEFSFKLNLGRVGVTKYQLLLYFGVIAFLLFVQLLQR